MYKFIEDKDFLKRMRHSCSDIVNKLVVAINNEDFLTVQAHLIGSGAKNLITQNANEDIDLDYNLVIINSSWDIKDCKQIKEYVRKKFNDVLKNSRLGACSDSKSCLSTTKLHFIEDYQTKFSIDLAIVREDKYGNWYRLIHKKTGIVFLMNDFEILLKIQKNLLKKWSNLKIIIFEMKLEMLILLKKICILDVATMNIPHSFVILKQLMKFMKKILVNYIWYF